MANIPVQEAGVLTFQPAEAGGDSFENDGNTQLQVIAPGTGTTVKFANGRACSFGEEPEVIQKVSEIMNEVGKVGAMSKNTTKSLI